MAAMLVWFLKSIDFRRAHILSELSDVVAGRKVVGHSVPFAIKRLGSTEADFARTTPDYLSKMAFALLEVLVIVVVVGLLVPLLGHLFASQLVTCRCISHSDVLTLVSQRDA